MPSQFDNLSQAELMGVYEFKEKIEIAGKLVMSQRQYDYRLFMHDWLPDTTFYIISDEDFQDIKERVEREELTDADSILL